MNITLTVELGPQTMAHIQKFLEKNMSQLSDAIAAASKSADDAIQRVQADVDALNAKIQTLQAQVDAGGDPALVDKLNELRTKLDALDPTKPDVLQPA
jgi:hypothetical protein